MSYPRHSFRIGRTRVFVQARFYRPQFRRMPLGVSLKSAWQVGPFVGMTMHKRSEG